MLIIEVRTLDDFIMELEEEAKRSKTLDEEEAKEQKEARISILREGYAYPTEKNVVRLSRSQSCSFHGRGRILLLMGNFFQRGGHQVMLKLDCGKWGRIGPTNEATSFFHSAHTQIEVAAEEYGFEVRGGTVMVIPEVETSEILM